LNNTENTEKDSVDIIEEKENKNIEKREKKKKDKSKYILIVLLFLLIAIVVAYIWYATQYMKQPSEFEQQVNEIAEIDYSKQQDRLNQLVEEGMINIQYSLSAEFKGKTSTGFNVKNIKNNHYPIRFTLYDENGNSIYQSKQIPLGYEINSIELEKELSKGKHEGSIKIGYEGEGNVSSTFPIYINVK
jgi:flagellar basal body-associated protein FliL